MDDQNDYDQATIRATGSGLRDEDYDDLTPDEAEQVAEAQKEAIEQFDDRIRKSMTPEDVSEHKRTAILAAFITLPIILVTIMLLHSMSPKTAVDDLGLDAAHGVYVADKANVLDDKVKQQAYDLNKRLEKSDYHAQIMVVVVDKVPRKYGSINDYSMAIAEKYKPGARGQNTGLLYTVAIKDHKARLEVGYGLEGKLSDVYTVKLQQPANAHYKDGEYSAGVSALLDGVQALLLDGKSADEVKTVQSDETDRNPYSQFAKNGWMALFVIVGALALFVILLLSSIGMFLLVLCPFIAWFDDVKKLIDDVKEHRSRIENPELWKIRDKADKELAITTAVDMARHPELYRHSSDSSFGGGSSFSSSSSSSSGGGGGGGSFGGGGATTSW